MTAKSESAKKNNPVRFQKECFLTLCKREKGSCETTKKKVAGVI